MTSVVIICNSTRWLETVPGEPKIAIVTTVLVSRYRSTHDELRLHARLSAHQHAAANGTATSNGLFIASKRKCGTAEPASVVVMPAVITGGNVARNRPPDANWMSASASAKHTAVAAAIQALSLRRPSIQSASTMGAVITT